MRIRIAAELGPALVEAAAQLQVAGCETPRLDARLLVAHAASVTLEGQIRDPGAVLSADARRRIRRAVTQRMHRKPIAHITGQKEFWSLPFFVTAEVLIPRPDSELLVESVLNHLRRRKSERLHLMDFGTGSGCLLLALLTELPRATGLGIDLSPAAISVAEKNAQRLGLGARARFVVGDWSDAEPGQSDVVVANPPYIPTGHLDRLAPELAHEPRLALDGGVDGMAAYRRLLPEMVQRLAAGGVAAVEVGAGQAGSVPSMMVAEGLTEPQIYRDLGGTERCLIWVRRTAPQCEKRLGNSRPTE